MISAKEIINYGKDTMQSINNILEKSALLLEYDNSKKEDIENAIKYLDKFLSINANDSKLTKFLKYIGLKPKEDKKLNSDEDYKNYQEELQYICNNIEKQKQETLLDIDLKNAVIDELNPLVNKLSDLIEEGKNKKENFDLEIKKENNYDDTFFEGVSKTKLSNVFSDHLFQMMQANILYQDQIQGIRMQINLDYQILNDCDTFLNITSFILKAQGALSYDLQKQTDKSNLLKDINSKTITLTEENISSLSNSLQNIEKNNFQKEKSSQENKSTYQKQLGSIKWN